MLFRSLGERQGAAVEADLVEHPAERIIPTLIADRHDVAHAIGFQGLRRRGDERPVHIEIEKVRRVDERHGHVMPVRIGNRVGEGVAGTVGAEGQPVIGFEIELLTAALPQCAVALADEMALS